MNPEDYQSVIRGFLGDKRYEHSLCVARAAKKLARRYGADEKKAETAGVLHDIMKELPADKQLEKMGRNTCAGSCISKTGRSWTPCVTTRRAGRT